MLRQDLLSGGSCYSVLRVFRPVPLDGYEMARLIDPADYEATYQLWNGTPRLTNWRPIPVSLVTIEGEELLLRSDAPWLGSHALVLRAQPLSVLADILGGHGEILPLRCAEAELAAFNVTCVVDALDQNASSVVRFSDGRMMQIRRFAFHADAVRGVEIFKIPDLRVSDTFVSERFVDRWLAAGLAGLGFEGVWSDSLQ